MREKTSGWERIVELAKRVDARANARRPVDEDTALELARAIGEFQRRLDGWTHGNGT